VCTTTPSLLIVVLVEGHPAVYLLKSESERCKMQNRLFSFPFQEQSRREARARIDPRTQTQNLKRNTAVGGERGVGIPKRTQGSGGGSRRKLESGGWVNHNQRIQTLGARAHENQNEKGTRECGCHTVFRATADDRYSVNWTNVRCVGNATRASKDAAGREERNAVKTKSKGAYMHMRRVTRVLR
jgi:hypothetical protein